MILEVIKFVAMVVHSLFEIMMENEPEEPVDDDDDDCIIYPDFDEEL